MTKAPKVAEILYWDDSSQTWENILNNGSREFEFRWDKNIECEPFRIQFDQVYSTNKIMLKTLDSYTSWEIRMILLKYRYGVINLESYHLFK